ncbi:hypothetical protein BDR26DRAFT_1008889 [Obelidium mucronatum]|nr:hypothetical protein BDR26DRAFT_1008889 [Obelidium mucronatum]
MSSSINDDYEQIGTAYIAGPQAASGDGKRKVAFLFGWLEGQFKYLEKYAQVYRSKGYTTIVQLSTTADYNLCHGNQDLKSQDFDSPHRLCESVTNPYLKSIVWTLSYAALVPLTLFDTSNHAISRSASYAVSTKNKDGNVHGPRLFLYSDSDDLVQASEVKEYIQQAKEEGVVVEERFFVGSPHVKHAVVFKEEYWNTVDQFLGSN